MIATWMLYSALVSALVGIAALAFERVAGARQLPMRFVWLASMGVSVAWTLANGLRRLVPDVGAPVRLMPFTISLEPTSVIARRPFYADWATVIDRGLLALWIGLSVLLIIRLVQGVNALRRTRTNFDAA